MIATNFSIYGWITIKRGGEKLRNGKVGDRGAKRSRKYGEEGRKGSDLVVGELSSTLLAINFSHLAAEVGEAATHTLDGAESELGLDASINVGVQHTQNVLKVGSHDKRLEEEEEEGGGGKVSIRKAELLRLRRKRWKTKTIFGMNIIYSTPPFLALSYQTLHL
jgi:hypothetical protein